MNDQLSRAAAAAEQHDFQTAIDLLTPLATAGNTEAQYRLGYLALTECELVTLREAFSWFESAAKQGHPDAMYQLATFPSSRQFPSPLSPQDTWSLLLKAAGLGQTEAQYCVAASLATGEWYPQDVTMGVDLAEAVRWYRRAAETGHAEAQFNLALMLWFGEGCDPDRAAATAWAQTAAARGHEGAVRLLDDLKSGS